MSKTDKPFPKWLHSLLSGALLVLVIWAGVDIYQIAGHGAFLGHFDKIWGAIFIGYLIFSTAFLIGLMAALWLPEKTITLIRPVLKIRNYGWLRWPLAVLTVTWPAYILLYTSYGFDFSPFGIRLYFFVAAVILGGLLLTTDSQKICSGLGILQSIILFGAVFLMAKSFVTVTNFPLSLTWSEGNRMWDYSVLWGRDLYIYPVDKPLEAYIDQGRQSLWGLPFLISGITIAQVRLWSALVFTVPYALFGWILFHTPEIKSRGWVLAGLWVMLFLNQGPIYTPLVLAAILVALPRRWPLLIALPLIFVAGYYAQLSRLTWMFAPGIWAAMMAINDHPLEFSRAKLKSWGIVAAHGLAGFLGGFGISGWKRLQSYFGNISTNVTAANLPDPNAAAPAMSAAPPTGGAVAVTDQALLWARLWPNPTYREGVLLGLLLAIGPLLIFLLYLVITKLWKLNNWQKLGLALPLLAFMAVGIVISVKIGGGSNLHNLDMLLVALVFVAAFGWERGGYETIIHIESVPHWLQGVILLLVAIPAFYPVIDAYPLELPPVAPVEWTLEAIQSESDQAVAAGGEVLFMDQRQLLTFGFIKNVPLVAEYEKKIVMDKAMSGDAEYFADFYRDLANQRFALIITEPQNIRYATADDDWSQENDVWVEWVTKALLCYYEPRHEIKKTAVWILVPRAEPACVFP